MGPRGPVISAVVVDQRVSVTSPATGQVGGSGAARCGGGNRSSECFDRYSYGYSGRKQFIDLPHALKVRFINPDKEWQEDERIVYADGYGAENAERFETVDMMGCTSPEQAWREGRYHLAVGKLRPETHEVFQDVEALRATDGDLVMFAHDVILVGLGWKRH